MNTQTNTINYGKSKELMLAILISMIIAFAVAYIVNVSKMTFSTAEATTLQWASDTASWKGGW